MRRSMILTATTSAALLALLASSALAQAGPTSASRENVASDPPPRIAMLAPIERAESRSPSLPGPAPAQPGPAPTQRQAPNPKLGAATCTGLDVAPGAPGVLVFDDDFEAGNLDAWSAPGDRFSPRGVLDLVFSVELKGLTGEALLRVELTSPAGHAHQTLEAPVVVATSAAIAPQSRIVDGYPYPVPVRFAVPDADGAGLTVSIAWPLAGTHVVSHGLYGEWTAASSLVDPTSPTGSVVACPPATFTLSP